MFHLSCLIIAWTVHVTTVLVLCNLQGLHSCMCLHALVQGGVHLACTSQAPAAELAKHTLVPFPCCRESSPNIYLGWQGTQRRLATGDVFNADSPMGPTLTADEETAMVSGYKSGIRHAGWLHKLVGKTPLDVRWKKYWVSLRLATYIHVMLQRNYPEAIPSTCMNTTTCRHGIEGQISKQHAERQAMLQCQCQTSYRALHV